jgi:probable rRNA maturation factor
VEIAVEAPQLCRAFFGLPASSWKTRLARFCARAAAAGGLEGWDISLLFCGDQRIAELNGRYRGKDSPTDVLSFPREPRGGDALAEGDIAISIPALQRNAQRFVVSADEELKRLLIHGILHLAGMDHGRGKGRRMLSLQNKLLEQLRGEEIVVEGSL